VVDDFEESSPVNNADRAEWARVALEVFASRTRQTLADDGPQEVISDFICDLHHLADAMGAQWHRVQRLADMHYRAEVRPRSRAPLGSSQGRSPRLGGGLPPPPEPSGPQRPTTPKGRNHP
jgi:hypothetical protein